MVFISLFTTLLVFYTVRLAGSYFYFWIVYLLTSLTGVSELPLPPCYCPAIKDFQVIIRARPETERIL